MSDAASPDPDALIEALREAAGEPPLVPLSLGDSTPSLRPGPLGRVVSGVRSALLRLIAPSLGELLAQLERDRHRLGREVAELRHRVDALEAQRR